MGNTQKNSPNSTSPIIRTRSRLAIVLVLLLMVVIVGIVADVALLLERYATLTNALDSAAIAAAREIRTTDDGLDAALNVSRQLIELRGLDVVDVRVETCDTSTTLCPTDERQKLVRVSADIASNTVFSRFVGRDVVQLSASSTAEIAALDLVILIDVSESMLDTTTPEAWARIGMGQVYIPPKWEDIRDQTTFTGDLPAEMQLWEAWLNADPQSISNRLDYEDLDSPYAVRSFAFPGYDSTPQSPRPDCRVQFYPYSLATTVPTHLQRLGEFRNVWGISEDQWQGFMPAYDYFGCCNDPTAGGRLDANGRLVPLDDADGVDLTRGDFDFSDLICEPFRKSRQAVRDLLEQVDFEGGDRVAFVTFDRGAFIMDPDGANGGDRILCEEETLSLDPDTGKTTLEPLITCRERAIDTLERHIGIRAEPNFYTWNEDGGGWTDFVRGENDYPVRGNCPFQNAALPNFFSLYSLWDWGEIATANGLNPLTYYPLSDRAGLYHIMNPDPESWGTLTAAQSYELWASCRGSNISAALREGYKVLTDSARQDNSFSVNDRENRVWAMALISDGVAGATDPVRINGRKPVPADPYAELETPVPYPPDNGNAIIRYGTSGEYGAFGLCPTGSPDNPTPLTRTDNNTFPFCLDIPPDTRHFCPPPRDNRALVGIRCTAANGLASGFSPNSADLDYDCDLSFEENTALGNVFDIDIGVLDTAQEAAQGAGTSTCDPLYDVDDHARDWADFITQGGIRAENTAIQRPAIYTIGIGVDFPAGSSGPGTVTNPLVPDPDNSRYVAGDATENPADYLGEELLRYIADAGDNFRIDTDYQQDWLDNRLLDNSANFEQRGICEDPDAPPGTIAPLPPRTDCGNYFNTPDADTIAALYTDIKSRLFIRLVDTVER